MRKFYIIFSLITLCSLNIYSQSWRQIKNDDSYLKGEGYGDTTEEADASALSDLISQIMIVVQKDIIISDVELITSNDITTQSYIQSKLKSYSQATLTNTSKLELETSPQHHVVRFVKRSEVQRIFEGRIRKVREYVSLADKAEQRLKLDDALRQYYWAFSLLKTVPHSDTIMWNGHTLNVWLPQHIQDIFDDIDVEVANRDEYEVELLFTYQGKKVRSLDYTYDFNNGNWSNLFSAKDGLGIIELIPNLTINRIRIRFEYAYKGQSLIDKDVEAVVSIIRGKDLPNELTIRLPRLQSMQDDKQSPQIQTAAVIEQTQYAQQTSTNAYAATSSTSTSTSFSASTPIMSEDDPRFTHYLGTMTTLNASEAAPYKSTIDAVVQATINKNYALAKTYFTPDGALLYDTLIHYGNAKVLNYTGCAFTKFGKQVVARSVPMSFSFSNGARKTFIEDIVFTLNADGKIDNLAFGLDKDAANDVMSKTAWPEEARQVIVTFLENYKTAYALKRINYLNSIFADDAVIITGKVITRLERVGGDQNTYKTNKYVQRTQLTKEEYLSKLAKCFSANDFVNIRFGNSSVVKAGKGGDVYGIQLRQDYYSTHYGDSGYLFLLVNMNDRDKPTILVRTWQDEVDPELGRPYGLPDF